MRECVALMAAGPDFDDYRRADIRFHILLAQATGVPRLVALATEVQSELSEIIAHIAHPAEVLGHSNAEHARIVEALTSHDEAEAVALVRRHLEGTEHILAGLDALGAAVRCQAAQRAPLVAAGAIGGAMSRQRRPNVLPLSCDERHGVARSAGATRRPRCLPSRGAHTVAREGPSRRP